MTHQIIVTEAGEISQPPLHDAEIRGLLFVSNNKLLMPISIYDGARLCLVLCGVERLRVEDFRQGNIILDVTVSSGMSIDAADVAYAYGLELKESLFLQQTMERLIQEGGIIVRVNPSYGGTLVCICNGIEINDDSLPWQT